MHTNGPFLVFFLSRYVYGENGKLNLTGGFLAIAVPIVLTSVCSIQLSRQWRLYEELGDHGPRILADPYLGLRLFIRKNAGPLL